MTSRVAGAIEAARAEGRGAFVGYLPIGFPDMATSIEAAVTLAENGADVLELGPPYSDPVMDGTVIQEATQQVLAGGFRLRDMFPAIREITRRVDIPVVVMTYWNPVFQYGVDRYADDLLAAGGAGLITPDITPESAGEWIAASRRTGLDRIFLAAPTSTDERLDLVVANSTGFVYTVSTMGITGERAELDAAARTLVGRLRDRGAENGADVLELGPPYSDPVMDGLVIQEATQQVLASGFRLRDMFPAIREITSRVDIPVVVMTYWNPVLQYGVDRYADDLLAAGGAGLITPDITPESAAEWIAASRRTGLDRIFLAAPTSSDERLDLVVENSTGFVYTVSTMGITGERAELDAAARTLVDRLRARGAENACVGIGISSADQVAGVLEYADGAIVGTALVKALRDGGLDELARTARALTAGKAADSAPETHPVDGGRPAPHSQQGSPS